MQKRRIDIGVMLTYMCVTLITLNMVIVGFNSITRTTKQAREIIAIKAEIEELKENPAHRIGELTAEKIEEDEEIVEYMKENGFKELDLPLSADLQMYTYAICEYYSIDYAFMLALMEHESGFKTDLISSTNDYGIMQINKCNHKWLSDELGIKDFLDPEQSIKAGAYVVVNLFEKYEDMHHVLMAYNMGENTARRLWKNGIDSSKYSREIVNRQEEIQMMLYGVG